MHRKNRVGRVLLRGLLLLGLFCACGAGRLWAQADGAKQPQPSAVTVTVPINGTVPLQMAKRKVDGKDVSPPIGKVDIEKEGIITAVQTDDQQTVRLRGIAPGLTRLYLTAVGEVPEQREVFEVIVQQDIELLRNLLRRAVPTANVTPIPGAGNTIILTGWVAHAEDIDAILRVTAPFSTGGPAAIVNALKVGGVMQVQMDVVVARVARSEIRRMAVDLFQSGTQHLFLSSTSPAVNLPQSFTGGGTGTLNLPLGSPNGGKVNEFLAIFTQRENFLIFLQALRDNSLAKLLAEPSVTTLSGHAARFNSGGQQAVPQVSGLGGTAGVTFVDFGTTLNVLPIVLGNGKIYLEVEPEVSALDAASGVSIPGGFVPGRLLQRIHTSVEIEPGQTLAIGGLIQNTVQATSTKVPILGDLPFIGTLFSNKRYDEIEEEVIVLVTPHLVDPMDCYQLPKNVPGQETRRPDDFELFLEGILEAPRGQREVCPDRHFVPAYKHDPNLDKYPCGVGADVDSCGKHGCRSCGGGRVGCGSGCGTSRTCDSPVMAPNPAQAMGQQTVAPLMTVVREPASLSLPMQQEAIPGMESNGPMTAVPVSSPGLQAVPAVDSMQSMPSPMAIPDGTMPR